MHPAYSSPYQAQLEELEDELEAAQDKVGAYYDAVVVIRELVAKDVERAIILRLIDRMLDKKEN